MNIKLIMGYLLEIFICFAIILFSVTYWQKIDLTYYSTIAKQYENYIGPIN